MPFATHILVPTDFSEASELALNATSMLAQKLGTKVTLVHVHDPSGLRSPAQIAYSPKQRQSVEQEVVQACHDALADARAGALKDVDDVDTELLLDESAARAICDHAAKIGADLIVISTHGRTGLKHLLIGSVAERVVRHAQVPVLTLRSTAAD